jgi:hypothetical protein
MATSTGPAGVNIQKQDPDATTPFTGVTDQFRTTITDAINALTKTTSSSAVGIALGENPFGAGTPITGALSSTNYGGVAPLTAPLVPPNTVTNAPEASDVPGVDIASAALVSLFQTTAVTLSRVRQYSMVKTYLSPAPVVQLSLTEATRYGYLTAAYQMAPPAVPLTGDISANTVPGSIDVVVAAIDAAITAHRNTTVAFTETWCHSSCHSSHSSRGRR